MSTPDAVIVDAVRTPFGRYGGALARVRPDDLAAIPLEALIQRTQLDPVRIDDVILGCTNQAGEDSRNVARTAALLAGFPVSVPGQTVNRLCGSGLQAIASAAHAIKAGDARCIVAGGVESMTRAPWVTLKGESPYDRTIPPAADSTIGWRFTNPKLPPDWTISMGETAEVVAERHGISREAQDQFALESQRRAAAALLEGRYDDELVAVDIPSKREAIRVDRDEHPRPATTIDDLRRLQPAFKRPDGTVTAGSSSGINDGAGAALVMSADAAKDASLRPLARIITTAVAGVSPEVMGIGPVPAVRAALARANLTIGDIDLIELNEAFSAQVLACVHELGIDRARLNVNGGAIALGHPLGASGARLVATLVHEMRRRNVRYGLAAMCIGVGQGIAMILERVA